MTTPTPIESGPTGICPRLNVDPPAVTPWRFGLLDAATIVDSGDAGHALCGVEYEPETCVPSEVWSYFCGDDPVEKTPTDLDNDNIAIGDPFYVYTHISCMERGGLERLEERVRRAHLLGEQRAVEEAFWTGPQQPHLADPDCTVLNTTPDAAGALPVIAGVAALESAMAAAYGGSVLLHADRAVAAYAHDKNLATLNSGRLETVLGSRWAFYGASPNLGPDGSPAPDGHAWIYATSEVVLRRFPLEVLPPTNIHPRLNWRTNTPIIIAERTWIATRHCACFAVLVCLGC